jgi:hypothetical protein
MKLLFTFLALVLLQTEQADELSELHDRAETIIEDISSLEINMVQASRKVQLLLKDLKKWGETYSIELEVRGPNLWYAREAVQGVPHRGPMPALLREGSRRALSARSIALRSMGRRGRFLPLSLPK